MKNIRLISMVLSISAVALTHLPAAAQSAGEANTMPKVERMDIDFPLDARRVGRSLGSIRTVKLDILVEADGKAGDVKVADSSGYDGYDRAARAAALKATYRPAMVNGMPVQSRMTYDVSFGLLCNRAAGNVTCDANEFPTTCKATVCGMLLR